MFSRGAVLGMMIAFFACTGIASADATQDQQQLLRAISNIDSTVRVIQQQVDGLNAQISGWTTGQAAARVEEAKQSALLNDANLEVEATAAPFDATKAKAAQADMALKKLTNKLREQFESDSDMTAATKEVTDASNAQSAARAAALKPLGGKQAYTDAVAAEKTAEENVKTLRNAVRSDRAAIVVAADALLSRQRAVAAMEQEVLIGDKGFQDADAGCAAVVKAVAVLRAVIPGKIQNDPTHVAAVKELDGLKALTTRLEAPLKAANSKQAAAKLAASKAHDVAQRFAGLIATAQQDVKLRQDQINNLMSQRDADVQTLNGG